MSLLLVSNLTTYQRLTYESVVAEVVVKKLARQTYQLALIYPQDDAEISPAEPYLLHGDEWQLDARIIKWTGWANVIGLDSYYQLERLSGRYTDIDQANAALPGAHQLRGEQTGMSIWKLKSLMKSNLPFLDAYYGQSVYVPMRDTAKYSVTLSQTGLIVRPANEAARQALQAW